MSSKQRIGCISLGQGPRADLEDLHQRLFAAQGRSVELVWKHVLDGFTATDLNRIAARDGHPAIRSVLQGADPVWLDRDALAALVADAVAELEAAADVALILICAAEELPTLTIQTRRPVILPARAMVAHAEVLAVTRPAARIGLVTYGDRQREQQRDGWSRYPWAAGLEIGFSGNGGDLAAVAEEFRADPPDLIFVWAYGAGIQPGTAGPAMLSRAIGAPVILAAEAAVAMAARLLPAEGSA